MALHEHSVLDPHFGDYVNHDLAGYHVPTNADVGTIETSWLEEEDPQAGAIAVRGDRGELRLILFRLTSEGPVVRTHLRPPGFCS